MNQIRFENIGELWLESLGVNFQKGTIKIIFYRVSERSSALRKMIIDRLNAFQVNIVSIESHALSGKFDSVEFIDCRIDKIRAFGIDSLPDSAPVISFAHSHIQRVESQALKKMTLSRLQFTNTSIIEPLAHRAFYELTINELFSIVNCSLGVISSRSIELKGN